jgi:hypothetical protein
MADVTEANGFLIGMVVCAEGFEHLGEDPTVRLLGGPSGQESTRLLLVVGTGVEEPPSPDGIDHEAAMRRVGVVTMGHDGGPGLEAAALGEDPADGGPVGMLLIRLSDSAGDQFVDGSKNAGPSASVPDPTISGAYGTLST